MPEHIHVKPALSAPQLRDILRTLGLDPCVEDAPDDEDQEVSGLLAALLAATQWHIQGRRPYADQIDGSYHLMRTHLGFGPCTCGSPHDNAVYVSERDGVLTRYEPEGLSDG